MQEINKIHKGECIKGMSQIGSGGVDLIVSDPPYLINYASNYHKDKEHRFCTPILNDDNEKLIKDYMRECYRVLKDNSAAYIFCSAKKLDFFMEQAKAVGFTIKNVLIWHKNNHTAGDLEAQYGQCYEPILYLNKGRRKINGKRLTDVWEFDRVSPDKLVHQNQKPVSLIMRCILKSSNENDLVLDGFMGSGTTAVACLRTSRKFIGWELDDGYYDVAQKRLANESKKELDMFGYHS